MTDKYDTTLPDWCFRDLSPAEDHAFRAWARENYQPNSDINPTWHTVVRDECRIIDEETLCQTSLS